MGAKNEIIRGQRQRLSHHCCFLPNREVGRPFVVVADPLIDSLFFDAVEHRLEFTDVSHVAVEAHQRGCPILGNLRRWVGDILVKRNFGRAQTVRTPHFGWVNRNGFGHKLVIASK